MNLSGTWRQTRLNLDEKCRETQGIECETRPRRSLPATWSLVLPGSLLAAILILPLGALLWRAGQTDWIKRNMREAIEFHLDGLRSEGEPLPALHIAESFPVKKIALGIYT